MGVKFSDYFLPHPKQKLLMREIGKGNKVFYGGARGGGKTAVCLASAVYAAIKYPGIKTGVFRATFDELREVFIDELQSLYPENIFKYKFHAQHKVARFENGSKIIFRSCERMMSARRRQGAEYQLVIIDEAPNIDEDITFRLMGSVRNARIENFLPTVFMTGNPGGLNDAWFVSRFIRPDYGKWRANELEQKDKYIFIEAKVQDNPSVSKEYMEMLSSLPDHLREAWLHGNWDVFEGKFFDEWDENVHMCKPFVIPTHWRRAAGFDLGFTDKHPSIALWGAQDPDTGRVYVYDYYMNSTDYTIETVKGVSEIHKTLPRHIMWADPTIFTTQDSASGTDVARLFTTFNIPVMKANNDRVNGWDLVKQYLHWDEDTEPQLVVFNHIEPLLRIMPKMRYQPHNRSFKRDAMRIAGDDAADALRYMLMMGFEFKANNRNSAVVIRSTADRFMNPLANEIEKYKNTAEQGNGNEMAGKLAQKYTTHSFNTNNATPQNGDIDDTPAPPNFNNAARDGGKLERGLRHMNRNMTRTKVPVTANYW